MPPKKAFTSWSQTTPGERSGYLLKIADAIEKDAVGFATLEALNCGKPINAVLNDEIPAIVDCYRFFAGRRRAQPARTGGKRISARPHLDDPPRSDRHRRLDRAVELSADDDGLEAGAKPLFSGNTVVFKPSEQTPLTALKMAKLLSEILPEGVVNVILGRGESVGNALINHAKIGMISITGDVATGKKVLQAAAKTVKRTHLELGGKAPVIVFDDADIDAVVAGIRTFGYYNAGQDCTAACRIYADAKVYDNFVADLSSAVSSIRFNQVDDTENEIGPLISRRQRDRVESFVARASEHKHMEITLRRQGLRRQGLLLHADRHRRRPAGRRNRPPRGLRPGRLGHPLLRCR